MYFTTPWKYSFIVHKSVGKIAETNYDNNLVFNDVMNLSVVYIIRKVLIQRENISWMCHIFSAIKLPLCNLLGTTTFVKNKCWLWSWNWKNFWTPLCICDENKFNNCLNIRTSQNTQNSAFVWQELWGKTIPILATI